MLVWSKFRFATITSRNPVPTGYVQIPIQNRESLSLGLAYSVLSEQTASASGTVYRLTWGAFTNTSFRDWETLDESASGSDAEAFLETGHMTFGDSARMKYAPYLTIDFERTEISISGSVA